MQIIENYLSLLQQYAYVLYTEFSNHCALTFHMWGEGNLHSQYPPREYLSEYTSRGKPKIPPVDRTLMDPGHKARNGVW